MNGKIPDAAISHYLWRWSAAISGQANRIKEGFKSRNYEHGSFRSGSGDAWSDSVLLLEALHQFQRWYDHAMRRWPDLSGVASPDPFFREAVADLRKMTIHADDFIRGEGRGTAQRRFQAQTPFQHSATTLQVCDGVLVFGGRLRLLDAAADALTCADQLYEAGYMRRG